jgi:hypothetical protein
MILHINKDIEKYTCKYFSLNGIYTNNFGNLTILINDNADDKLISEALALAKGNVVLYFKHVHLYSLREL